MTDNNPKTSASGIIGQILGYVDKPWKAVVIIAFALIGGLGWLLYEQRDIILESWLTPESVELKVHEVPQALEKLTEETDADLIQIWAVDLGSNSQRFIAARRKDGERPIIPSPRRLPIVVTTSDVQALVDVLNGHPTCVDTKERESPLMRRLTDRGVVRACAMPIPPSPEAFVGVIYLAWHHKPDSREEDIAVSAAREVAGQLIKR
jgi:hypothetical protein